MGLIPGTWGVIPHTINMMVIRLVSILDISYLYSQETLPTSHLDITLEFATVPSKRQSLIPFPRVGKRQVDNTYHRRLLRSQGSQLWHKRDDFKRRITKRSSWGKSRSFDRRILRSTPGYGDGGEFKRRITGSWDDATHAPEMMVRKRQSLIPFPRTGKRSGSTESSNRELNQVYVYDSPQEDDEDPETEPEPEPEDDEDEDEFDTLDDDDLVFEDELDDLDDDSLGRENAPIPPKCTYYGIVHTAPAKHVSSLQ